MRVTVIPNGTSPRGNGLHKNPFERLKQGCNLGVGQTIGPGTGMNSSPKQGLVGVDIPDPGNPLLIQEHGLDPGTGGMDNFFKCLKIQAQRFGAKILVKWPLGQFPGGEYSRIPEFSLIIEHDPITIKKMKNEMVVSGQRECPGNNPDPAGHLEMKDHEQPLTQGEDEQFSPSVDLMDGLAGKAFSPRSWCTPENDARIPEINLVNDPARDQRGQTFGDGFDFRQFRHALILHMRHDA
jgi:hypothetical protein